MAQPLVKQFRYYNNSSDKNEPSVDDVSVGFWAGNILADYGSVVKLGIQTLPGTKFKLNLNSKPMVIDHTGVYELDTRNIATTITDLSFDYDSLLIIDSIDNASLIIDILYNNTEGTVTS